MAREQLAGLLSAGAALAAADPVRDLPADAGWLRERATGSRLYALDERTYMYDGLREVALP